MPLSRKQSSDVPIRLLTAVPICDGHDSAISTINLEFIRHGFEVIYLGYHRSARDIARAAVQEDVRAIGISSYNGGHVEFFAEVSDHLAAYGASDIGLFGGGGGTITHDDARKMQKKGVSRIFFAGTPLEEMIDFVKQTWSGPPTTGAAVKSHPDHRLGRLLTEAALGQARINGNGATHPGAKTIKTQRAKKLPSSAPSVSQRSPRDKPLVIGVCGPGGAGKTTLIDELVLRFLRASDHSRIGILSHDPSIVGAGALLGDRAAMYYSQNDRVFMRSLATAGRAGGLSPATERCLQLLKNDPISGGFDVILVETVGIGQEAVPFGAGLVDKTVFVMSPEYGSRLQLQKIAMLDQADIVVVNKGDLSTAKTASAEVAQRLALSHRGQQLVATVAKRHRDAGVDALFATLNGPGCDQRVSAGAQNVGSMTCI